jgi:hypothetical protein
MTSSPGNNRRPIARNRSMAESAPATVVLYEARESNMVPLATIRELFEYNYWARDRQLKAARP